MNQQCRVSDVYSHSFSSLSFFSVLSPLTSTSRTWTDSLLPISDGRTLLEGTRKDIRLDAVAVAGAASAAGKIRLAAGPLYPRRSQRFNKKQMTFDTTIIVKKIVCQEVTIFHHTKYDTSSKIQNLAKVATLFTGRPDRMPKGNRVMGRMGHTGQRCPFCPFLCFLWASCPVALAICRSRSAKDFPLFGWRLELQLQFELKGKRWIQLVARARRARNLEFNWREGAAMRG